MLLADIVHTANRLYGHKDLIFLPACTKIQPTTTFTSYVSVKYVSETNIPPYRANMLYMPYMKSVTSTVQQGELYIYLTYITRKI